MHSTPIQSKAPSRGRGRPRRLSPEALLDAALALFEEEPDAEFTLAGLARRLDVPITSLYTYFPNRDALLDAAAERVFARFDWAPREDLPWQEEMLSWMHAVRQHFEHHPIAQNLLAWERHISPAWLRVLAPMIALLYAQGLRGPQLVRCFAWFINGTIGLIDAHAYTVRHAASAPITTLDFRAAGSEALRAQIEFLSHVEALDHDEALQDGFRVLVNGIADAIAGAPAITND